MGKSRKNQISERQLRMIELCASGRSYADIGKEFGITGSGVRTTVRDAARLLARHGASALPDNSRTLYSVEALVSSVPSLRDICEVPAASQVVASEQERQELRVKTKLGEIVVSVKADSEYPGVYIDLKGPDLNDKFEKNTVGLAMIEFDPEKNKIQNVVYGDGNEEDFTHLVEYENIAVREMETPSLEDQISAATACANKPAGSVKEAEVER